MFVDSDDYVDSNYIQNFISGLLPDTDLVFQGINEVHGDGTIIRKIPRRLDIVIMKYWMAYLT